MKFKLKLLSDRIHKWEKFYIDYAMLENCIHETRNAGRSAGSRSSFSASESSTAARSGSPRRGPTPLKLPLLSERVNTAPASPFISLPPKPINMGKDFVTQLDYQIEKVDKFYVDKMQLFEETFDTLNSHLDNYKSSSRRLDFDEDEDEEDHPDFHISMSIKRAFVDLYRQIKYLESFCTLNYTGFTKIIKKYDKIVYGGSEAEQSLAQEYKATLADQNFVEARALERLQKQVFASFSETFCGKDHGLAGSMLMAKRDGISTNWELFHTGMRFGVGILLFFWVAWDCIIDAKLRGVQVPWKDIALVYSCMGCFILLAWCWGLSLFMWQKFRINSIYLFELNALKTSSYMVIWREAMSTTIIYLSNFLLFFKSIRGEFLPHYNLDKYAYSFPLGMFLYMLLRFLYIVLQNKGFWIREVIAVLCSPFTRVTFLRSFIGDVLTSLVKVNISLGYLLIFFFRGNFYQRIEATCKNASGVCTSTPVNDTCDPCTEYDRITAFWAYKNVLVPFCSASPLFFRFMQNMRQYHDTHKRWPYWGNAGKYALAQCVVMFGTFNSKFKDSWNFYRWSYTLTLAGSTLYTYSWDVFMDWGLGKKDYQGLRDRLMYHKRWPYMMAVACDLLLRFSWTLTLIPVGEGPFGSPSFQFYLIPNRCPAASPLPVEKYFHCCGWSEWEHLSNTQGYRRVDQVPLHFEGTAKRNASSKHRKASSVILEVLSLTFALGVISLIAILTD